MVEKYLFLPGDEPRISPLALTSRFFQFGDRAQGMHDRSSLPQTLLSSGSDIATPTGDRVLTPSFNLPLFDEWVKRDFHVVTGTLQWPAEDFEPRNIEIQLINDELAEFSEDLIVVLYIKDYEMEGDSRDEEVDLNTDDGGGGGGDGGEGGGGDGGGAGAPASEPYESGVGAMAEDGPDNDPVDDLPF